MDVFYLILGIVTFVLYVALIGIGIAEYIIQALGLYRIAQKRKISNPWLAWVPLANLWTLGNIVDDFEAETGSKRSFRVILFTLGIVVLALAALMMVVTIWYLITMSFSNGIPMGDEELMLMISFYAILLPLLYVSVAYSAIAIICTYKIHEYIYPEKAVKYIVVSLLVPLGYAICLLKNSKRCEEKIVYECAAPAVEIQLETISEEPKQESAEQEETADEE